MTVAMIGNAASPHSLTLPIWCDINVGFQGF